ncbi:hypothetical protein [Deinococcus pimensis]|uniref:hypothetical protein n=1 Tax=Deinococcus pimensis TaxID=309888 RepID=UPI0012F86E25|nr:hypothetical protein [Deinococcus pimensis]
MDKFIPSIEKRKTMNYGEQLASWYLRLNGFLPMPNFVLHRQGETDIPDNRYHSDIDLLAIRFPYVYEEIGGRARDWDQETLSLLLSDEKPSGVIVEVKTSEECDPWTRQSWIERSIQRLGMLPLNETTAAARHLHRERSSRTTRPTAPVPYENHQAIISTLLVCPRGREHVLRPRYTKVVSLEHCEEFIIERILRYRDPKRASRLFFPDELMQYLSWKYTSI